MRRGMIAAPPFMPPMGMRFPGAPPMMPPLPAGMPTMPNMPPQQGQSPASAAPGQQPFDPSMAGMAPPAGLPPAPPPGLPGGLSGGLPGVPVGGFPTEAPGLGVGGWPYLPPQPIPLQQQMAMAALLSQLQAQGAPQIGGTAPLPGQPQAAGAPAIPPQPGTFSTRSQGVNYSTRG